MRLLVYSDKNNIKTFSYSHNILIRLLRSKEDRRNTIPFDVNSLKMNEKTWFCKF